MIAFDPIQNASDIRAAVFEDIGHVTRRPGKAALNDEQGQHRPDRLFHLHPRLRPSSVNMALQMDIKFKNTLDEFIHSWR